MHPGDPVVGSRSRSRPRGTVVAIAASVLAAAVLGGCGVGAGEEAGGVHLRVTDDFGAKVLLEPEPPKQGGSDTVMRLLQRNAEVQTKYSGGFVQAIDGVAGAAASEQLDWFYYANGVLADRGAAAWRVRDGDRIWWDRHRWDVAQISAVVGDYPQPMKDGSGGRFAGAQLDCRAAADLCNLAAGRLKDAGVAVTAGPASAGAGRTRVIVGPWAQIKGAADELEQLTGGPEESGVFVRVGRAGIPAPLDATGAPVAFAAVGTHDEGLVAALRTGDAAPVWVVTGADEPAVGGAVRALDATVLSGRMAVYVRDGRAMGLPLRSGDQGRGLAR